MSSKIRRLSNYANPAYSPTQWAGRGEASIGDQHACVNDRVLTVNQRGFGQRSALVVAAHGF